MSNFQKGSLSASSVFPNVGARLSNEQLQTQFNNFLNRILDVFTIDEGIKAEIRATMQKLNEPDKISFINNSQLQDQLLRIDTEIQAEYLKIKDYINPAVWIEFLKNLIQLQVLVFLKKIPLDELIRPFENLLNEKVAMLTTAKKETAVAAASKTKYLKYKKKYLELN
jgi:hypothetical protein